MLNWGVPDSPPGYIKKPYVSPTTSFISLLKLNTSLADVFKLFIMDTIFAPYCIFDAHLPLKSSTYGAIPLVTKSNLGSTHLLTNCSLFAYAFKC